MFSHRENDQAVILLAETLRKQMPPQTENMFTHGESVKMFRYLPT